jgi:Gpi18-like mannosyltransferase
MNLYKKRPLFILSIVLVGLSLIIRFQLKEFTNRDMLIFEKWYDHLYNYGWIGLADGDFSNYPPAYLYLLWFSTLLSDWVGRISAIKLIPTLFDLLSAFTIFRMARLRYDDDISFFSAASFFILPTIMFNSTGWGQIDSLYTSFLLVCVYLLLREKPFWAMAAFSMAFSFKSQSIFLLPFLGILFLKGKIRWSHFLLIPVVYAIMGIPAAWIGRSWTSILYIYIGQVGQFRVLSFNAPNLYTIVPAEFYETGMVVGLLIFFIGMAAWGWNNWRTNFPLTHRNIILAAFTSLALVPFLLPKMHERYFYPADVFSLVAALFIPEIWFIPIAYQVISLLSYIPFIFGMNSQMIIPIAMLMNAPTIGFLLWKQWNLTQDKTA